MRCQNRVSLFARSFPVSFGSACRRERLRRSPGEVTGGPAGQLVLVASRGLVFSFFFFYYSSWGPPSQPGCSDVRRAGHQPSGNVQAATHGGNRRTAQTRLAPSLPPPHTPPILSPASLYFFFLHPYKHHTETPIRKEHPIVGKK